MFIALFLTLPATQRTAGSLRIKGDLDADGIHEEYIFYRNQVTVREGEETIWCTPQAWSVTSFNLGDVDNDGSLNLVMSLWKEGSFGDSVPFWQEDKDVSYKNHLFVYKMADDTFKPVWCSSNLERPIQSFSIEDVNSDGARELVVREGQYKRVKGERYTLDTAGEPEITVWQWNHWGFDKLSQ